VQPEQLPDRVSKLVAQLKEAEKRIADLKSQTVLADVGSIAAKSHDMWGIGYIAHRADGVSGNDLRTLALEIRNRIQDSPAVVAVVGGTVDKPSVVIVTTEGARARGLDAGELVRVAAETLGGRGGGKADIGQGGGTDGARAEDALKSVEYAIGHALQSS
jgi:alanyl-tRNA synthetase